MLKDENAGVKTYEWGGKTYQSGDYFHPHEVLTEKDGYPTWNSTFEDSVKGLWEAVGVDELHSTAGLNEYEFVRTGLVDSNGNIAASKNYRAIAISSLILKILDICI